MVNSKRACYLAQGRTAFKSQAPFDSLEKWLYFGWPTAACKPLRTSFDVCSLAPTIHKFSVAADQFHNLRGPVSCLEQSLNLQSFVFIVFCHDADCNSWPVFEKGENVRVDTLSSEQIRMGGFVAS